MNVIQQLKEQYEWSLNVLIKNNQYNSDTQYQLQKEYFPRIDAFLDGSLNGPYWLQQPEIAQVVYDSLLHLSHTTIDLDCFTIMSNHVHAVFSLKKDIDLYKLMQSHKSFTAKKCNVILEREGPFWERESYDHIIRPGEFDNIVNYILHNAVKAGLVKSWQDWKWTYLK